jgi:DNA topoisomerase-1
MPTKKITSPASATPPAKKTVKKATPKKTTAPAKKTVKKTTGTTRATKATASRTPRRATGEGDGSASVRAAASSSVPLGSNLVIVESPTKAKTISKYLGRNYAVRASYGHVRDLPKSKLGVDTEHEFAPQYLIPRDKSQTVKGLKADVSRARAVYLATDPDREGEAIAWHLLEATGAAGKPVYRVEFHEVTRDAVQDAIAHPRQINMDLVNAQQARRILDRLVGYGISPLLWKKVKGGLSAGRVQSVALRMVVEREREIEAFVPVEYWSIEADFSKRIAKPKKSDQFHAQLINIAGKKAELHNAGEANAVVKALQGADYIVDSVKTREMRRNPAAPFTTSTLQQEASRKLGFTAKRTMMVAQQLYEGVDLPGEGSAGLITYMRTDSTNVATVAQQEAREVITARYGAAYLPASPPTYTKKAKGAQEAHEAIRPSSARRDPEAIKTALSIEQ